MSLLKGTCYFEATLSTPNSSEIAHLPLNRTKIFFGGKKVSYYDTIDRQMKRQDRGAGRMYIIEAEKGVYKIGVTQRSIEKRLQSLQRNTYKNLKVLYLSPEYQEIYQVEYMFKIWANDYLTNIRGEWYQMGWRKLARTKKWLDGKGGMCHSYYGGRTSGVSD